MNSLAWLRATCPEAGIRDGKEAVETALKACELSEWKDSGIIDTLAAAYAEAGDFDQAIKYQKQVLQMVEPSTHDGKLRQRLALYGKHKPYREWMARCRLRLEEMPEPAPPQPTDVPLLDRQQSFGFTQEDNFSRLEIDRANATLTVRVFDRDGELLEVADQAGKKTKANMLKLAKW